MTLHDEIEEVLTPLRGHHLAPAVYNPIAESVHHLIRTSDRGLSERLVAAIAELGLEVAKREAVLDMTVGRLGGRVEGRPTIRLNFLQRVDELVEIERLFVGARERRGAAIAVIGQAHETARGLARELAAFLEKVET
jgi:hypothetical protein